MRQIPRVEPGRATVLVVEDEWLIATQIAHDLQSLDCRVLGPAPSVAVARALLEDEVPRAALLDIRLGRETVFALADLLTDRKVPFAFLTAFTRDDLPPRFADCPLLTKPFGGGALKAEVAALLRP
ncbi:response regulator [Roseomonas hellenica]|uniref:Response regulator n=1 Tax=Plastoroseomonas hellenica TaxID=2687306 RepID=A0ABS5EZ15_9PROT|nr:response regulator [Plastoroseomonas hellenica]MBR0665541.1 response regulator [Plastoroseomonas hellenica]